MKPSRPTARRRPRRSRQSGVLLGIVLILLAVLFAAGAFALWSMRGDTASAGRDRLERQLFDCAEQGLAYGKQYFAMNQNNIPTWVAADVCTKTISTSPYISALPCTNTGGPFPMNGAAVTGYPDGYPFTQSFVMDTRNGTTNDFQFTFAVYNDPAALDPLKYTSAAPKLVVYSRCTDLKTLQQRSVSALITVTQSSTTDYTGQAGRGFRNQGNQNTTSSSN
jgi:hypothetical protein